MSSLHLRRVLGSSPPSQLYIRRKMDQTSLSIRCYAWTEYKFTCVHVCVCVCVSVCESITLSVNSPTGQTPQRIFTVDSLTDAGLRKDVPVWDLNDE